MAGTVPIFVSWSGELSRDVALALHDWLPYVLNDVRPFVSDHDIDGGERWYERIATELQRSKFAVICLTQENAQRPWLHFEAGAIAMSHTEEGRSPRVAPYLIDLQTADLTPPLSMYQRLKADEAGTRGLVRSINNSLDGPLATTHLERSFEQWWPQLRTIFAELRVLPPVLNQQTFIEPIWPEPPTASRPSASTPGANRPSLNPEVRSVARRRLLRQDLLALNDGVPYAVDPAQHSQAVRITREDGGTFTPQQHAAADKLARQHGYRSVIVWPSSQL